MLKQGKKNVGANIKELIADNSKKGTAKGANGKVRPMKQIVAIAISASKKNEPKHSKAHEKGESKSVKLAEKKMYKKS